MNWWCDSHSNHENMEAELPPDFHCQVESACYETKEFELMNGTLLRYPLATKNRERGLLEKNIEELQKKLKKSKENLLAEKA